MFREDTGAFSRARRTALARQDGGKDAMPRKVLLQSTWKLHVGYHLRELAPYPPDGYEFVTQDRIGERAADWASRINMTSSLMQQAYRLTSPPLIKAYFDSLFSRVPDDIALVYSGHKIVKERRPWIIELDNPMHDLLGSHSIPFLAAYKRIAQKTLASEYCTKVFCFSRSSMTGLLATLDCSSFRDKIEVLPRAVHAKSGKRTRRTGPVRVLFMGSANLAGEFELRGGKEVLEAFRVLVKTCPNAELVVRSDIPSRVKRTYPDVLGSSAVKVLERRLTLAQLQELYTSADIFVFPGHYDCWLIVTEAMSYGLPVIATDVHGMKELVTDGETGFLIKGSRYVPYFCGTGIPMSSQAAEFQKGVRIVDPEMVEDLVAKVSLLANDAQLRTRMGKAGREEVELGRLSIAGRNEVLKRAFDEATA